MSEIFGAVGQIAAASIQASAMRDAAQMQMDALQKQRDFVYSELEPSKVGGAATVADVQRSQAQLALQGINDPDVLRARYQAESGILKGAGELGAGSPADLVARTAASEAITGPKGMEAGKAALIDSALQELHAGASLPPDVQAELVKTGLERSGMTVGAASPKGIGGEILRKMIGERGLALQAERQQRASQLLGQAGNLEAQRQSMLQQLFPNLSSVQLGTLAGQQNVLNQAEALKPQAGLKGTDVANLWLARVGATNQLAQQSANIGAEAGMGAANVWGAGLGGATRSVAGGIPTIQQSWPTVSGWMGGGTPQTSMNVQEGGFGWM